MPPIPSVKSMRMKMEGTGRKATTNLYSIGFNQSEHSFELTNPVWVFNLISLSHNNGLVDFKSTHLFLGYLNEN